MTKYKMKMREIMNLFESSRIPVALQGLAAEARKAGSFENFKHDYLIEIKHGTYWHYTNDPNFRIDPERGPRDMSSMGSGGIDKGALMVSSDLNAWAGYGQGGKTRPYVALIDLSDVPRSAYRQTGRGFGSEFYIHDPSKAKVLHVVTPQQARRIDRARARVLPNSEEALRKFYDLVVTN